jgi:hypothetical protein
MRAACETRPDVVWTAPGSVEAPRQQEEPMRRGTTYPRELRERAVRMVAEIGENRPVLPPGDERPEERRM